MVSRSVVRGKLVLIPFPFDDFTRTKIRPVLCLTDYVGTHQHIVVAFITSNLQEPALSTDLIIDTDYQKYGLQIASKVQLHRLMTVSNSVIKRELGELSQDLMNQIQSKLGQLFALAN